MRNNPDDLKKKKIDVTVSAKVYGEDLETLKNNDVNISKLIREAISDTAKRYRKRYR